MRVPEVAPLLLQVNVNVSVHVTVTVLLPSGIAAVAELTVTFIVSPLVNQ